MFRMRRTAADLSLSSTKERNPPMSKPFSWRPFSALSLLALLLAVLADGAPRPAGADESAPAKVTWIQVIDPVYGTPDDTFAERVNAKGQVVGEWYDQDFYLAHGFILDHGAYTLFDYPGLQFSDTFVNGINDRGDIVGSYDGFDADFNFVFGGYVLSHGVFTQFSVPGASFAIPLSINARGDVTGYYGDADFNLHGFVLRGGVVTTLDVPGADLTIPSGINAKGQIVGSYVAGDTWYGFRWDQGVFTTLQLPWPTVFTRAMDINDRGEVAGFYDDLDFRQHGFVLSGGKFTRIDAPGASRTVVTGINAPGNILGWKDFSVSFLLSR